MTVLQLTSIGDSMKYLLAGKAGYCICDFENLLYSKWQRNKTKTLTASLVPMAGYWSTARAQPIITDLEAHLFRYYTIVERISTTIQPYEYW